MPITPETLQRISIDVTQAAAADFDAAMHASLEEGWLIWSIKSPAQRYLGYKNSTLQSDFPLVVTEDYLDLWKAGVLPDLQCLREWRQVTASGQPPQSYGRYFWALLTLLPSFVFEHFQRDFINLIKQELRQEGVDASSGP